jgi:hypothetical protein
MRLRPEILEVACQSYRHSIMATVLAKRLSRPVS